MLETQDGFILMLSQTERMSALEIAERLRLEIADASLLSQRPVTVSIGVAMSHPGDSVGMLLARAERALLSARIAGHGAVGHEPVRATSATAME